MRLGSSVAHDHGAATLQIMMKAHPERIRSAVLTNAEAYDAWPSEPERPYLELVVNPVLSPIFRVALSIPAVRRDVFQIAVHRKEAFDDEVLAAHTRAHTTTPQRWQRLVRFFRWQLDRDHNREPFRALDGTRRFARPTLILWGKQDHNFRPELAERFAADIPGTVRIEWLEFSAHMPMQGEPDCYAAAVLHFLEEEWWPRSARGKPGAWRWRVPKVVDTAQQRARIRDAARAVFARRGVAGTGLGQIAMAAGISRTGVYHYYTNKETLVRDLARELLAEEERLFAEALHTPGAIDERIRRLADAVIERFVAWAHYGRPLLEIWAQENRRLRPLLRELRKALASLIAEGQQKGEIASDLAPAETATLLIALIDGLMLQVFMDPAGVSASDKIRNALAEAIRRILRPRGSR